MRIMTTFKKPPPEGQAHRQSHQVAEGIERKKKKKKKKKKRVKDH